MADSVPNGQRTYSGTTAQSVTFADRYQYVTVTNTGADAIYVTSDGSTPSTSGASNTQVVLPNETRIIANELPLWYQSSRVIPQGVNQFGGGNTASSASSPGMVESQTSLAGQMANPGTNITISGTSGSIAYTIEAAG